MGNATSKQSDKKLKTLPQVIDYIASNYILTQSFQDMENLAKPAYCDKLVILTSKVIGQTLNDVEINYLAQRLKQGVIVNEMTSTDVIFLDKDKLPRLDVQNSTTKRRLCIGIAKFYVQVAHLFAAIVSTINPVYTYKDSSGQTQEASLINKQQIPTGADVQLRKVGLCGERLNALLSGQDIAGDVSGDIPLKPKICGMNSSNSGSSTKSLSDEPGILDLERLYYDDYDYDNGGFKGMTPKMRAVYEEDVKQFYKEFTGEKDVPSDIKKFSDIKLRSFQNSEGCAPGGLYTKTYTTSSKDSLFKEYAKGVKEMIKNTDSSQKELLNILDSVFKFSFDQVEGKHRVIIDPSLNEKKLQELINTTRQLIIKLYLTCEKDFANTLSVYEAIIARQVFETSKAQLETLDKQVEIAAAPQPRPPVPRPNMMIPQPVVQSKPVPEPSAVAPQPAAPAPVAVAPPEAVTAPQVAAPVPNEPVVQKMAEKVEAVFDKETKPSVTNEERALSNAATKEVELVSRTIADAKAKLAQRVEQDMA